MLDITKYDERVLGLPNLVCAIDKSRADYVDAPVEIYKSLDEFMKEAAVKYPRWKFIGFRPWIKTRMNGAHVLEVSRFRVYEGRELVGEIGCGQSSRGKDYIVLTNDRIEGMRERGTSMKTGNKEKALKLLGKHFGVKTPAELWHEGYDVCSQIAYATDRETKHRFDVNYSSLVGYLIPYFMEHWDEIRAIAEKRKADPQMLDAIPDLYDKRLIAHEVRTCLENKKGVVVVTHGTSYVVKDGDTESLMSYDTDTLPEWIKRGVGLLKLVENRNVLKDVGLRADDDTFFVIRKDAV